MRPILQQKLKRTLRNAWFMKKYLVVLGVRGLAVFLAPDMAPSLLGLPVRCDLPSHANTVTFQAHQVTKVTNHRTKHADRS